MMAYSSTPPLPRAIARTLAGALLALSAVAPVAAQVRAVGDEIVLPGGPTARLSAPAVTFTSAVSPRQAVLLWESSSEGVARLRLDPLGTPDGTRVGLVENEIVPQIPYRGSITLQRDPVVVPLEKQRIVAAWVRERQQVIVEAVYQQADVLESRVLVRRFDRDGRPIGKLYAVSDAGPEPSDFESSPRAVRLTNGRVAVVWQTSKGGDATGVYGRILNGRGMPVGDVFRVDDGTGGPGSRPALAAAPQGGFLIVWQACCDAGGDIDIFARSFTSDGTPAGSGYPVGSEDTGNRLWPAVARGDDGAYLVAWMAPGEPRSELSYRVFGRALDGAGRPVGVDTAMSYGGGSAHGAPTLAAAPDGFLLAWTTWVGNYPTAVHATAVTARGAPRGEAIRISSGAVALQWDLALAGNGKGEFLAAWQGFDGAGRPAIRTRALTTLDSGSRSAPVMPAGK